MSLDTIYKLFKQLESQHSILSFKGIITKEFLAKILETIEERMIETESSIVKRKKVYNVMVECLQNLYHHNEKNMIDTEPLTHQSVIFIVSEDKGSYKIKTGNYIKKDEITGIENKILNINRLNKNELRELYRSILKNGKLSHKGTAGLGFIDIARKSGNDLKYKFITVDDEYSFFCLNVIIN